MSARSSGQRTRRTLQQSTKCLLHVGCVPRRGLHKRQSIRLRKGTCFRGGDRPEVDEVALVPEKDQAGLRCDLPDVGNPPRHILERFAVCDVVNDDDAVCAAIRCVRDDPEALLARFKECEQPVELRQEATVPVSQIVARVMSRSSSTVMVKKSMPIVVSVSPMNLFRTTRRSTGDGFQSHTERRYVRCSHTIPVEYVSEA
jgi:hypothetical protein